jgi:hypothetical protein
MNNLLEHLKILILFFYVENWLNLCKKKFCEEYWTRRRTFNQNLLLKTSIFKILNFLKMCPIFVGSVNNFGRSDGGHYLEKKLFFPLDMYYVHTCISGFMPISNKTS